VAPGNERQHLAALYRQHGRVIFSRCFEMLRDESRAEDATQEVFLKALRRLETFEEGRDPVPWLYGIATWHCIDVIRASTRRTEKEGFDSQPSDKGSASDLVAERQLATQVLQRFDSQTQAIALAVLVDGREHREVAETLGVSKKTIARKLDRFLDNARKFLLRSTG
jgi:RNA polymerase sigma-70 factor (ECF subfamily)